MCCDVSVGPRCAGSIRISASRWAILVLTLGLTTSAALADAQYPLIYPGASLTPVLSTGNYYEGPSWDPVTEKLYFTQMTGGDYIVRLTPPNSFYNWQSGTNGANGTYLSNDGRLLVCQGSTKRIVSLGIGPGGPTDTQVLAQNSSWLAPNDLCQAPNGNIYFTTPDWNGVAGRVYLLTPTGAVTTIITELKFPNGVITSLDGQTLYVSDSEYRYWKSYPILANGTVGSGSVFFNPTTGNTTKPDGMSIDELGNLYFCGRGGVWIVSPTGATLDFIPISQFASNVTFGGSDGRTLYITCQDKLYSLAMEVRGSQWQGQAETNARPVVDAGADQAIYFMNGQATASVSAAVSDDGNPAPPGQVSVSWSQLSGPATVGIDQPTAAQTTLHFTMIGLYELRLTATDGQRYAYDEIAVRVRNAGDFNGDFDVTHTDYEMFAPCMTGPGVPYDPADLPAGCTMTADAFGHLPADIDADGDVDMSDFGKLQRCYNDPNAAPDPACADD